MKPNAATDAQPMMAKSVQPKINEKKLPNERRRYSYTPPDSSVSVERPANVNAPNMVTRPAPTHASMMHVSLKPVCAIGMIFLNTPEPIIIPATNKIPVVKPSTLLRLGCWLPEDELVSILMTCGVLVL